MSTIGKAETSPPSEVGRRRVRTGSILSTALEKYGLLLITIGIAIFFSVLPATSETFPTSANLKAIAGNQSVAAIAALGALIPLVIREFDLSIGANLGLSSVFCASALVSGWLPLLAIGVGVGMSLVVGLTNALLITRLKINGVITTLGMATALQGVVIWRTKGNALVEGIPKSWTKFGGGTFLGMPNTVWVLAVVALGVYFMLQHTPMGRYLYMLGSNRGAAQLVGLKVKLYTGAAFVMAGLLVGLAGVLQVSRSGSASAAVGEQFTLPALAAAFLSGAAIRPGRFNTGGLLVAIAFLATLNGGLNLAGAQTYVSDIVNGAALVVGVGLAGFFARQRGQTQDIDLGGGW